MGWFLFGSKDSGNLFSLALLKTADHVHQTQIEIFDVPLPGQPAVDHHVIADEGRADIPYAGPNAVPVQFLLRLSERRFRGNQIDKAVVFMPRAIDHGSALRDAGVASDLAGALDKEGIGQLEDRSVCSVFRRFC